MHVLVTAGIWEMMNAHIAFQQYSAGDMLTGDLKKILIDLLSPMVAAHQEKRRFVTDDMVLEFMRPRPLNFQTKPKPMAKVPPFLQEKDLLKLEEHLRDHSYIYGHQFSDVDVLVSSHVNDLNVSAFVNVNRWLCHVTCLEDKPLTVAKSVKVDILSQFGK